ncbi:hypothetical protein ACFYRL_36025 [Streptomyces goshikiensis]|uniref:hypothetical protein n=1 Tax=Streptomyces goshikiensis TaxID=1942 RepID=UPI00369F2D6B
MLRGAISDEEIAAAGKVYQEAAPAAVDQFFPDVVGRLAVQDPYTLADLSRDLTTLLPGILAQPNVNIVDVTTLADGAPVDDEAFLEAMAATGSGTTVLTAPPSQEVPDSLAQPTTLALKSFTCVRSTNDQRNGSDEIYWMCAADADSNARSTYASPRFGDVDSGESRPFPAGAPLFHGEVGHHLMTNIQCWQLAEGPGRRLRSTSWPWRTAAGKGSTGANTTTRESVAGANTGPAAVPAPYAFRGKGTDRAVYWGAAPGKFPDITSSYSPTLSPSKGAPALRRGRRQHRPADARQHHRRHQLERLHPDRRCLECGYTQPRLLGRQPRSQRQWHLPCGQARCPADPAGQRACPCGRLPQRQRC